MSLITSRRSALLGSALALMAGGASARTKGSLAQSLDETFRAAMEASQGVGATVAIVREGETVLASGYGARRLGEPGRVTERTLMGIGSCGKAFTSAALAQLVDDGLVAWEDPVTRHLPGFALSDPRVTEAITVRDLLLHVSGLALGAGDLMVWPRTTHTRAEIVAGLRHLPLDRPFKAGYAYDNVLYVAAGEIVARLRGRPLEAVFESLFSQAGLEDAAVNAERAPAGAEIATNHARFSQDRRGEGLLRPLPPPAPGVDNAIAAGGLMLSARDLARWMHIHLAGGVAPGGGRVWSQAQQDAMWRPGVVVNVRDGATPERPDRSNFDTYALGWQVSDYRGRRMVWHAGSAPGNLAVIALIPSLGAGVAVLTNSEDAVFGRVGRNSALDRLMGASETDWLAQARARQARPPARRNEPRPKGDTPPARPLAAYAGRYRDAWYGEVIVNHVEGQLRIDFTKTPGMSGRLEPWGGETFRTWFEDRSMEDALATFDLDAVGGAAIRMNAWSPDADFSYDFHHLDLRRIA